MRDFTLSTFLDARAVARHFSLAPRSLWRWRKDPELRFPPADMVIKNRLFWLPSTIARFQAEQRAKGTATHLQGHASLPVADTARVTLGLLGIINS